VGDLNGLNLVSRAPGAVKNKEAVTAMLREWDIMETFFSSG
jgi:hypothetical protein